MTFWEGFKTAVSGTIIIDKWSSDFLVFNGLRKGYMFYLYFIIVKLWPILGIPELPFL